MSTLVLMNEAMLNELEPLSPREVGEAARAALAAKHRLAKNMLEYWAEVDRAGSVQWYETATEEQKRLGGPFILDPWARTDPVAFLQWVENLPAEQQAECLRWSTQTVFDTAAQREPARALALLLKMPDRPGFSYLHFSTLFRAWAKVDPVRAAREALSLQGGGRVNAIEGVAAIWSAKDPKAALQWIQSIDDAKISGLALEKYTDALADKDPKAAAQFALDLPLTAGNRKALESIVMGWAIKDAPAAFGWIDTFKDREVREPLLVRTLNVLIHRNPEAALQYLPKYAAQIEADSTLLEDAGRYVLAKKKGEGLQALAEQLPTEFSRVMMRQTLPDWIAEDEAGFARWSESLPEGKIRDQVYDQWGFHKAEQNLAEAIAWAGALPNSKGNRAAVLAVAQQAFYKNKGGVEIARRVVSGDELSDAVEGWLDRLLEEDPGVVRKWLAGEKVLSPAAKERVKSRLGTEGKQ